MKNEIQFRVYAEDHIRARLLEAENYKMLNQLRSHCLKGSSQRRHALIDSLSHSLIVIEEKLKGFETSLATWFGVEGRIGRDFQKY